MRRQIYKKLLQWKDAKDRKPLVLEGARQEAIAQAHQYEASKQLRQRANARGWELHMFAIVFRGWKLITSEEIM